MKTLLSSLHVDDFNTGANTLREAFDLHVNAKNILKQGSFHLRKFKSNNTELENHFYLKYPEDNEHLSKQKVLGINYNKTLDDFIFDLKKIRSKFKQKPTKRNIFHSLSSIFDPLGLLTPLGIGIKILFQDVCQLKVSCGEILADDCFRCQNLLNAFNELDEIAYPRKYCFNNVNDPFTKPELHSFLDASRRIYATVIYLRFIPKSRLIKTALVTSEAKVLSSTSTMTIPRAKLNHVLLMGVESKNIGLCLESVNPISNFYF